MTLLARRFRSLTARLLLASALLLPLFLGVTGVILDSAFQRSLDTAEAQRLQGQLFLLFSVADIPAEGESPGQLTMPAVLMEPGFERLNSGLYAFIYGGDGELLWRSNSAALLAAPTLEQLAPVRTTGELVLGTLRLDGTRYVSAHYDVIWEDELDNEHPLRFALLQDRVPYRAELAAYRTQLWRWLGAVALLLLLTQAAILRWGLRPLGQLAEALKAMERGDTRDIAGEHPRELQQVVDNLNQVLAREQALRQRYRNSLGDLAHSLKTPLAVLQGKLQEADDDLPQVLAEQLARMNQVVHYQLQRPLSDHQSGQHRRAPVVAATQRLISALQKVYRDKPMAISTDLAPDAEFAGDDQDLLELLGNLLDNAFKYGRRQISVQVRRQNDQLRIDVDDDGPGVPADQRQRILQRGQRLDTAQPGQGIGLAVCADIVHSYEGALQISDSPLGGARFRVLLPAPPRA